MFYKKMVKYGYFLILILTLSSCASIYMPGVPNTPMLNNKNEFAGSGHISPRGNINFNTAFALTDHIAGVFNFGSLNSEKSKKDLSHSYYELGAGYFSNFETNKNRILEVYVGYGAAKNSRTIRDYENSVLILNDKYIADYQKVFVQVNYTAKELGKLRVFGKEYGLNYGTAWRLSFANTTDFTINGVSQANEDNIFIEPVFFTRMVLDKHFQLQLTSGSNFGLHKQKYLTAGYSVFSVGFVFNIGHKNN